MKAFCTTLIGLTALPIASFFSFTACASEGETTPVAVEEEFENYLDAPQTPGTWTYVNEPGETLGLYGQPGQAPSFIIRCGKESKRIALGRVTTQPGPLAMTVQTETTRQNLTANPVKQENILAVDLDPNDPLLDAMAITKGRFAIVVENETALYLPAWTELSRVIEDCR